jgi:exodeoxyribonuclease VII small subunit
MEELKFEQALKRLEDIVQELEQGELELDRSLEIFEEGVKLARLCTRKLDEANRRIEVLTADQDGGLSSRPFPGADQEPDSEEA